MDRVMEGAVGWAVRMIRPHARTLALILAALAIASALVWTSGLEPAALAARLLEFAQARPLAAAAVFVAVYLAATFLLIPGVLWLSIAGGAAFGIVFGALLSWASALTGAVLVFQLARTAWGARIARRAGGRFALFRDGFQRDALKYMIFLRLLPVAPFFAINLGPAFLGVRLRTFALGSALGILPGSILYATIGAGLGAALSEGGALDPAALMRPEMAAAFTALAILVIAPVLVRVVRAWRAGGSPFRRRRAT